MADDPVARVQSMAFCKSNVHFGYAQGKFYPLMANPGKGAKSLEVPGVVIRKGAGRGEFAVLAPNLTLNVGDIVITGPNTLLAIEFLIGGRAGINRGTSVEIINERSIAHRGVSLKRLAVQTASLWWKADAKTLKQPLEIQTNGGVMGIKG